MSFRLVVDLGQRSFKSALREGENLIGTSDECQIRVSHPTVSRRHALIRISDHGLVLEDLGSTNGTRLGSQRLSAPTAIAPGVEISFGSVRARVVEVLDGDLAAALTLPPPEPSAGLSERFTPTIPAMGAAPGNTLSASALEEFTLERLPKLLELLEGGSTATAMAQAVGAAIFETFPCPRVEVVRQRMPSARVFFAEHAEPLPEDVTTVEGRAGDLMFRVVYYPSALAEVYGPVVDVGRRLVGLAAAAGPQDPDNVCRSPVSSRPEPPPLPQPPSIDSAIHKIYRDAARVALGDVSVLIRGESGTGKEVLAQYLHDASNREAHKLVTLNCAALPRDLLELELFGIEKGVATGVDARPGKFELADQGTLFLDEIGDMALESQARILRVLQEGEVYRLGGKQPRSARVWALAATNRDIDSMVRSGSFRADLFHRIAGWVVNLPALRDRPGDIPNLAAHFLLAEAEKLGVDLAGISQAAIRALTRYHWPGNVRELKREIARAALFLCNGDLLESTHLEPALRRELDRPEETLKDVLEKVERDHLERALSVAGSVTEAARRLGLGRSTLYRRLSELGIQAPGDPKAGA